MPALLESICATVMSVLYSPQAERYSDTGVSTSSAPSSWSRIKMPVLNTLLEDAMRLMRSSLNDP